MATTASTTDYVVSSNKTTWDYYFPPIKTEDVKVSLNGNPLVNTQNQTDKYEVVGAQLTFKSTTETDLQHSTGAPKNGVKVLIYRDTDVSSAKAVFAAGSAFRAKDLNNNQDQNLYAVQEINDTANPKNTSHFTQTGTGAVARTVDAKLKDNINVWDFIPVDTTTATTDCSSYFQAAINTGKTVYVPKGTYRIDSTLILDSNYKSLIGDECLPVLLKWTEGPAIQISEPGGTGLNEFSRVENFYIQRKIGGSFTCPNYNETLTESLAGVVVSGHGATIGAAVQMTRISNLRVGNFAVGFYFADCVGVTVHKCFTQNLALYTNASSTANGTTITSSMWGVGYYFEATRFGAGSISPMASIEIVECDDIREGDPTAIKSVSYLIVGADPRDIFFQRAESTKADYGWYIDGLSNDDLNWDLHIIRPIIDAFTKHAIYANNLDGVGSLSITGGYFVGAENAGAAIYATNSNGINISGGAQILGLTNHDGDSNTDDGIRLDNCSSCSIIGNRFANLQYAISLNGTTYSTIQGNVISAAVTGEDAQDPQLLEAIRLWGNSTYNTVGNNTIRGLSGSNKYGKGIYLESGSDNCKLIGNIIESTTVTTQIDDDASGTGYEGGSGTTNLSYTAGTRELASSSGSNVNLPEATTSNAGLQSSSDKTKLDGIETSATADQTAAEIRTLVESATDSNVFTDADHTKLNAIEASATADQTNAEIRAAVEAASDSNVFTDADHTKLNAIEASATADQTGAEIKTAYEAESNTNAYTDAEKTKLSGIAVSATNNTNYTNSLSNSVQRTTQSKLDDFVNILDFGVEEGTGKSNTIRTTNTSRFEAALAHEKRIYIPAGTYEFNSEVNISHKSVSLFGDGERLSILKWLSTGTSEEGENGIKWETNDSERTLTVKDLKLQAAGNITGSPIYAKDTDTTGGSINPNVVIENVVAEFNGSTSRWQKGFHFEDCRNSYCNRVVFRGSLESSYQSDYGFLMDGTQIGCLDFNLFQCQVSDLRGDPGAAFLIRGACEGIHIESCLAINTDRGVQSDSHYGTDSAESGEPFVTVINCHFNTHEKGILLQRVLQSFISNNHIQACDKLSIGALVNWTGIEFGAQTSSNIKCENIHIHQNLFHAGFSGRNALTDKGAYFTYANEILVDNNQFKGCDDSVIEFTSSVTNSQALNNRFNSCDSPHITNNGSNVITAVTGSSGTTNLSATASGTALTVESSSGTNVNLPAATTSAWGVMSDDDKTNLDANTAKVTNATHTGDVTGATSLTIANDAVNTNKIADDAVTADKLANSINTEIAANTAKVTNATHTGEVTGSGALTITADAVTGAKIADNAIDSEHYTDGSIDTAHIADDAVTADKLANSINTEIAANTAKTTNATHTGEVTGSGALTITDDVVDEANLKVDNSPTNDYVLTAKSSAAGGLTWAAASGGGGPGTGETYVKLFADNASASNSGKTTVAGYQAGAALANDGKENTFFGYDAGKSTTSGEGNVYIGQGAGDSGETASYNVAVGRQALNGNTANNNTAVGTFALDAATTGEGNTAVGRSALSAQTSGLGNVGVGWNAGLALTNGQRNTVLGQNAFKTATGSNYCTAIGAEALQNGTSTNAVAVGYEALKEADGNGNTSLGYQSGKNITSGTNNTCIGAGSAASAASVSNEITLGDDNVTKFRVPGLNFSIKDSTATDNYVLTVDANGDAGWEAAAGGGGGLSSDAQGNTVGGSSAGAAFSGTDAASNTLIGNLTGDAITTGDENVAIGAKALTALTTSNHNVAIGMEAAESLVTGTRNVFIGTAAGASTGTAITDNTGIGHRALRDSESHDNTAVGAWAGGMITSGENNVACGAHCLAANTSGKKNTAVGMNAVTDNQTGEYITAVGEQAARKNTVSRTTAIGAGALTENTSGTNNTAVGYMASATQSTANHCTSVGDSALNVNTGGGNTAVGSQALKANTSGTNNTALGIYAGDALTSAQDCVFLGRDAGGGVTTGNYNIAIGSESMMGTCTGAANVVVGRDGLRAITSGEKNVALGNDTNRSCTSGSNNVAIGHETLFSNTTSNNVGIGHNALKAQTSGTDNTVIGSTAGDAITSGGQNVCIGTNAGSLMTTVSHCVFVGKDSGQNASAAGNTGVGLDACRHASGTYNTCIGRSAGDVASFSGSNNTVIGAFADPSAADADNEITLGDSSIATLRCQVTSISSLSDRRDKTDINTLDLGLDFVNSLKPVKFKWDSREGIAKDGTYEAGFIAQDFQQVQKDNDADYLNLVLESNPEKLEAAPGKLIPILVKAVQEMSKEIETLKNNG